MTASGEPPATGPQEIGRSGHQPSFAALVPGVRWGILALSAFVAAVGGDLTTSVVVWGGVLAAHAAWRQYRPGVEPVVDSGAVPISPLPPLAIMVEVFLTVLAVDSTDYWSSPFAFCLLSVVVAAGLAQGFGLAVRVAGVVILSVGIPFHLELPTSASSTSASPASGPSSWCWSPSSPGTPAGSSERRSSATRRPSTGCRSWRRPTTCSSRSTGWPRACPPRSTSTRWRRPPSSACAASSTATSPPSSCGTT